MAVYDQLAAAKIWEAARALTAPATIPEIQALAGVRHQSASRRLRLWTGQGLLTARPEKPARYAIARASRGLAEPPTGGELSAAIWAFLRKQGRPATFKEIVAASGSSDRAAYCRIFRWLELGHLVRLPAEPARFLMTDEARLVLEPPPPPPPPQKPRKIPTMRARIWITMRVLKEFDIPLLVMTAEVNKRACEDFLSALGRAGYVRVIRHNMRRVKAGNHGFAAAPATYRLLRNTGPKCPVVECPAGGGRRLRDANTGETIPLVSRRQGGAAQ